LAARLFGCFDSWNVLAQSNGRQMLAIRRKGERMSTYLQRAKVSAAMVLLMLIVALGLCVAPQAYADNEGGRQLVVGATEEGSGEETAELDYYGSAITFIKTDGAEFGMYRPQEGTEMTLTDTGIDVVYVPNNKTVYKGFYLDAMIDEPDSWESKRFIEFDKENNNFVFSLDKSFLGKMWPVAPVKNSDPTATTSAQFYLAVPAKNALEGPAPINYDGDAVSFVKDDGSGFGMFAAQEGSEAVYVDGKVTVTYYPKNTTVYEGFYLFANIDAETTRDEVDYVTYGEDGKSFTFTVDASYCGKALPVAPVKPDGTTTATQYYLAIPAQSKCVPIPFEYLGQEPTTIKKDGTGFGMFTPQEGTIAVDKGDKVAITYLPKNKTVYGGFYFNVNKADKATWDSANFFAVDDEGNYYIELDKSYCGKAWPIAPIKKSDGGTSGDQYYFAIPAESLLYADYSAVDAAIASAPIDQGSFTDSSWRDLQDAIAAVEARRLASDQAVVDAWAKDIEDAVAALALTPEAEQAIADDIAAAEQAAKDAADAGQAAKAAAEKAAQSKKAADEAAKTPGEAAVKAAEQATKDAEAAAKAAALYKTAAEAAKAAADKALASAKVLGSPVSAEDLAKLETAAADAGATATEAATNASAADSAVTAAKTAQAAAVKAKEAAEKAAPKATAKADQKITAKAKNTKSFKASAKTGKLAKKKVVNLKKLAKVSAKTTVTYKKANKAGGKKIVVNKKTGKVTIQKGLKKGKYTVKIKLTAGANDSFNAAKAKTIRLIIRVK